MQYSAVQWICTYCIFYGFPPNWPLKLQCVSVVCCLSPWCNFSYERFFLKLPKWKLKLFSILMFLLCDIFKASALWADAFYKSKCPSVCPSVRLFVRPSVCPSVCSLLRYHLNVFLPPLPEVWCPIFLEIRNPWGKVTKRSGLRFKRFVGKWSKIATQKKVFFFLLILPYKTWWKPSFLMD